MKRIKNILFVSYIKNKGLRRLCFVIGLCLCIWILFSVIRNVAYNGVDSLYSNLEDANADVYFSYQYKAPYWYQKGECMAIYLKKKYNISREVAYSFSASKNWLLDDMCGWYQKECAILKAIKDEPVHLKCSALEDYNHSTIESLGYLSVFLLVLFYLPFLLICILKLVSKILKWIISGFKESNSSKKGKK